MNSSILAKLEQLSIRLEEVSIMLSDPEVVSNVKKFTKLSIEYAQLTPVNQQFQTYLSHLKNLEDAQLILFEDDMEIKTMAKEEILNTKKILSQLDLKLKKSILPKDPNDSRNIIIEIRAGTGGDEASIFSGDLFKIYSRYSEKQKWTIEIISSSIGEHGGFKEIIARISGINVYSKLKFESGAHRVQRVPTTESQGRIHTSACTVAIMPEVENIEEINININDVRIDTFRASGAGGQHVNKTDSAVRITHLPTGTVVECQDGRSQHKNKAQAMSVLASRILDAQQQEQQEQQSSTRKELIGSGDRSQRIRTYNYPQGRITDHRINLTLYKLTEIMEGNLSAIIKPLIIEQQTNQLTELNNT
ncbi:peptide chain release factor 1 [Candidatus Vesicomyidisocius calyptogenae]|uniref:Peptide chain release factor 1 n=1 Tax=Vesicomyosocius okutanii subsp. Calyptogena okutanii (strain HA) TaxID=412965 RepID=RF1_VESOH|nr:peptide chain release factor 1 [Candidatus Vesicomyosocius okutanii]A5CW65.1 RecName: Full=Peptide chain release factor 1; Short=RF-1 [Candidatus Vesicomyosocius okutanii]BAF61788.1 peptide chain release factor RF-1 [Candidatus Vesicomyosocius okutanii]